MKNLVIVEASGKVDSLRRELKAIGLFADVIATAGHIASNPKSLVPIELDDALRERSYGFREDRAALLEKIKRAADAADRIFIATDDDEQGDVIAYDLSRLLADQSDKLLRARLRAITGQELESAFSGQLSRQFEPFARNGISLRVIDRAIGATFTQVTGKDVVPVGRVQSSLLASIAEDPPVAGIYTLEAALGDGARFRVQVPVHSAAERAACDQASVALAEGRGVVVGHDEIETVAAVPWGYERVVSEVADRMAMTVEQAADLFQDAYEKGKVSYPRVRAGTWTRDAVEIATSVARYNRCAYDAGQIRTREESETPGGAHEAPRIFDAEMMLGRTLSVLDPTDALAVLVARNMIEAGQSVRKRRLTVEVGGMTLSMHHTLSEPRRNWKRAEPEPGYRAWPREIALLRYMSEKELGRPSTVVRHVARAVQHGLIEETGVAVSLTARGERWLARAREVGFSAQTSKEMEQGVARPMRDPYGRAAEVLASHGMLDAVRKMAKGAVPPVAPEHAEIEPV
jgi:DNA topoisomerase I